MTNLTHPVAPEEVMALLDGELASAEAQAVSAHLDHCAECAHLADRLRGTSQALLNWTVAPVSSAVEDSMLDFAAKAVRKPERPGRTIRLGLGDWRPWAIAGKGAVAAVLILVAGVILFVKYVDQLAKSRPKMAMVTRQQVEERAYAPSPALSAPMVDKQAELPSAIGGSNFGLMNNSLQAASHATRMNAQAVTSSLSSGGKPSTAPPAAPMIARSVSLTILVKDIAAARATLDSILARHQGYAADLTVTTPENAPRAFQASLRVPAPELQSALGDLKALGRVQNETQSGEEVTQQHADLVARLDNSRETEQRLRAILEQRTGKIEDVLQVEEEIARVRGEIESMEAEQKQLEHRVDFASIHLELTEEYKAQLGSPDTSASTRMRNAFVAGFQHVADTLLGIVLFLEEFGPVLLIWLAILGAPGFLAWRRYRRARSRV